MLMTSYEQRLNANAGWALNEGSKFFEEKSAVQDALRKIAERLHDLKIPYAIAGGMALFQHGYRRFTEGLDILLKRESLDKIHEALDGLGYVPPFQGSKNLRDTDSGVKIEFLIAGQFPGDGKPKPIAFPEPRDEIVLELAGVRYVNLLTLIELKIASGKTNSGRLRDLADVQDLITHLALKREFADQLHPYVQEDYRALWDGVEKGSVSGAE